MAALIDEIAERKTEKRNTDSFKQFIFIVLSYQQLKSLREAISVIIQNKSPACLFIKV